MATNEYSGSKRPPKNKFRKYHQNKNTQQQQSHDTNDSTINKSKIKKRIRDLERLIRRQKTIMDKNNSSGNKGKDGNDEQSENKYHINANVIVENQRALTALNQELKNVDKIIISKKFSQIYHKVRFFEKKKALRKIKKSEKLIADLEAEKYQLKHDKKNKNKDEIKKVKKKLKKAKNQLIEHHIDLAYVLNFPRDERYIALYASSSKESLGNNSDIDIDSDADSDSDSNVDNNTTKKKDEPTDKTSIRRKLIRDRVTILLQENVLPIKIEPELDPSLKKVLTSNKTVYAADLLPSEKNKSKNETGNILEDDVYEGFNNNDEEKEDDFFQ